MLRPVWKKFLLLAALVVAGMTLSASPAQAGWGHWRAGAYGWYGYGYYPAYAYTTSYCSPCVTSCGWSWYNPSWWGYSGYSCYNPCYTPCYGSYYGVATDCCNGVVVESPGEAGVAPTPAPPAAQEPAAAEQAREPSSVLPSPPEPKAVPPAPDMNLPRLPDAPVLPPAPGDVSKPSAGRSLPSDAALLSVVVPQDAQVYVNGMLTKTPGTQRQFVSYGLLPGYSYTYEVRAVVTRQGQTLSDTQIVRIRVGETRDLAFNLTARAAAVIAARLP